VSLDAKKVGERIRNARKERGMTQADLAAAVDITSKYLSNIECGDKVPKFETFISIANALGCDANSLLADVLDVTTSSISSSVSAKMAALPLEEQRGLLRILDVMIAEASAKRNKEQ